MATVQKRKRLIVANWKMYIETPDAAKEFVRSVNRKGPFSGVTIVITPAFPLISVLVQILKQKWIEVGAQTVSAFESGAHTGEVSARMLKHLGVSFVLIGHSERRARGETNEEVAQAMAQADAAGLKTILCIGEKERVEGGDHFEWLAEQLKTALVLKPAASRLAVAYEPIWAIGKTALEAMKPADLHETTIFIRKILTELLGRDAAMKIPILYGGSVEAENAPLLIEEGNVSGFLVGHASASVESFIQIIRACTR